MADGSTEQDQLFSGIAATGIIYCDREQIEAGDYLRVGLLPFSTLKPEIDRRCPDDLRERILADMEKIQARRGEDYQVSTSGQTVRLGWALDKA